MPQLHPSAMELMLPTTDAASCATGAHHVRLNLGCGINPPRDVRVRVSGGVGSRASWLKVWFAAMQCLAAHGDPSEQPSTFRPCRMYANPQIDPQWLAAGALAFTDPRKLFEHSNKTTRSWTRKALALECGRLGESLRTVHVSEHLLE